MSERPPPAPVGGSRLPFKRRLWIIVVLAFALPIAVALSVGTVVMWSKGWTPFAISGDTMMPGLTRGEFVFLENQKQILRGDIIAFRAPKGGPWGSNVEFLQRVVGLPGDRIEMRSGVPVINGAVAAQTVKGNTHHYGKRLIRLEERLPGGATYDILREERGSRFDNGGPFVVPAGSYFALGDNRDDVFDSRGFQPGAPWYVPLSDVTGRAKYVYWAGSDRLGRVGEAVK